MGKVQFRVRFDVAHRCAIETGYHRQQHCSDYRIDGNNIGTYREPATGLLTLLPSYLSEKFHDTGLWKTLTDWGHDPAFWRSSHRVASVDGTYPATMFTSILAAGQTQIPDLVTTEQAIAYTIPSLITNNNLILALESQFTLARDEGFCLHYRNHGDENKRYNNWFGIKIDDLFFHFSFSGLLRVYQYGPDVSQGPTTLLGQYQVADAGEIAGKDGYFSFTPIGDWGISVCHLNKTTELDTRFANANATAVRATLVKVPGHGDAETGYYCYDSTKVLVWVAANVLYSGQHHFGWQSVRYDTSPNNIYKDGPYDMGYYPSHLPDPARVLTVPTYAQKNSLLFTSIQVRKGDDSGAWEVPTPTTGKRLALNKLNLQSFDARYTPYVVGSFSNWQPVIVTRNTTPVSPAILRQLSFVDDDMGRFEGSCEVQMKTAVQRALVERGDTTFVLEKSFDDGTTWITHNGGWAQLKAASAHNDPAGFYYIAQWQLWGEEHRFDELVEMKTTDTAFDNNTIAAGINGVLASSGYAPLSTWPTAANKILPAPTSESNQFRFTPKQGDTGDQIIKQLLLFLKTKDSEYRLRYLWDDVPANRKWVLEAKPRDTNTSHRWTLTAFEEERGNPKTVFIAGSGDTLYNLQVEPPELNVLRVFGSETLDHKATLIPIPPLYNKASLSDTSSPDYLGRVKPRGTPFYGLSDQAELWSMGRRIMDAASHRRLLPMIPGRTWVDDFIPGLLVMVRAPDENGDPSNLFDSVYDATKHPYYGLWLKRRSVDINYLETGDVPYITYALDSQWESEMQ